MKEINVLDHYPRSKRPIEERGEKKLSVVRHEDAIQGRRNSEINFDSLLLEKVREFGKEYFDGDRLYGYGGYRYDPKYWNETVKRLRDYYKLPNDASILDVGCAKGFMLYDFKKLMPEAKIAGIDVSQYAYETAPEEVRSYMTVGNARELPYPDKSFDLVVSINTVDHLPRADCERAISEIQRVSKQHAFIMVNAWRDEAERQKMLKWNTTALTCMHVDEWKKLFDRAGYTKDFYWFFVD